LARHGFYDDIIAFDINQAYPTAVEAVNASIESKDKKGKWSAPNGIRFNDKESVFIKTLKEILKEKGRLKEKLKYIKKHTAKWKTNYYIYFAVKTQAAAFSHGEFGYARSRIKDYDVAEAITSTARTLIFDIMDLSDKLGYPWVYQHTDSIYLNAPKYMKDEITMKVNERVRNHCLDRGYKKFFIFDYEGFIPHMYVHTAARNVKVPEGIDIDDDDNWDVTGMNFYRSETPDEIVNIEINLIKLKFHKKTNKEVLEYLKERIKNLKNVDVRKLAITAPLAKKLEKYGRPGKSGTINEGSTVGIPYHIKAYMNANEQYGLELNVGDKFMVIPVLTDKVIGVKKFKREAVYMAFTNEIGLPRQYDVDYEMYLKSVLYGKIYQILDMSEKELELSVRDSIPNIDKADAILEKYIGDK